MNASLAIRSSFVAAAALAAFAAACSDSAPAAPEAPGGRLDRIMIVKERPIEEFVLAQGGVAGSGMGASLGIAGGAIVWIDRVSDLSIVVDYAGSIHRREARTAAVKVVPESDPGAYEGDVVAVPVEEPKEPAPPIYSGRIIEQVLPDGSARVTVDLVTGGALTFASAGTSGMFEKILFGAPMYRDPAAEHASSHLVVVYRTPAAGAPMPSLSRLIYAPQPGESIERITFQATAKTNKSLEASPVQSVAVDYAAFGGLGGSLGAIGTLTGATITLQ